MTGMPAALAFLMTAEPESGSRSTMSRALTPLLIMPSAMLWNLLTSPPAFWMSDSMPAASNACLSSGRSAVSHRADEAASGRMTPTEPLAAALVDDDAPAPPVEELEELSEPPQAEGPEELPGPGRAAGPSRPAALTATSPTKRLRMLRSFLGPVPGPRPRPRGRGAGTPDGTSEARHGICCVRQHIGWVEREKARTRNALVTDQ